MTDNERKELERLLKIAASEPTEGVRFPADLYARLRGYSKAKVEKFGLVTLNGAHEIIKIRIITTGLVNRTIVHPRELFRPAIKDNSSAVFVFHNHPSGSIISSPEDDEITERIKKAGVIIGIPLLDHIILGKDAYFSYKESGKI
jgi:DNA repair protein RadC